MATSESPLNFTVSFRRVLLVLAAGVGLTLGACSDADDDGLDVDFGAEASCEDYCAKAKTCDDDRDEQECINNCVDSLDDCMADERDQAIDQVDMCAAESCDDIVGCTIDAGAQCYFGL